MKGSRYYQDTITYLYYSALIQQIIRFLNFVSWVQSEDKVNIYYKLYRHNCPLFLKNRNKKFSYNNESNEELNDIFLQLFEKWDKCLYILKFSIERTMNRLNRSLVIKRESLLRREDLTQVITRGEVQWNVYLVCICQIRYPSNSIRFIPPNDSNPFDWEPIQRRIWLFSGDMPSFLTIQ